jgi:hypothetical protein
MTMLLGLLAMAAAAIAAAGGLLAVRRIVPSSALAAHNDIGGLIYGALAGAYGVLLAFTTLVVWQQWSDAAARVADEAGVLGEVYRDAIALPEAAAAGLRQGIERYVALVVAEEWPAMAAGDESAAAAAVFPELWALVREVEPAPGAQSVWYAELIDRLNEAAKARQERLFASRSMLPPVMWFVLLAGAVIVLAFSYSFGPRGSIPHAWMVAALAGMLGLILFTIAALNHPFGGITRVDPGAFRQLRLLFPG